MAERIPTTPFYFWRNLQDRQYVGKVDVTIPFAGPGKLFKFGGLYSMKDRTSQEDRFRLESGFNATTLDELAGDQNRFVSAGNIGILEQLENDRYQIGNYLIDQSLPQNNYTGQENIGGVYGMLTYQLVDNLKFVGGGRAEFTDIEVISQDTSTATGSVKETTFFPPQT